MIRVLRDAWIVARFDLAESLRSRKAVVLLVLYVAGAVVGTWIFGELLLTVERQLADGLGVARSDTPGAMTRAMMETDEVFRVLADLIDDADLARSLLTEPPLALFYHWFALTFAPTVVALTSSDAIAAEVASGSVRFALARTGRGAWAVGKLLGQTLLAAVGLALGAAGAWAVGWWRLASFDGAATAIALGRYVASAFPFAFAWVGVMLGVSQLTRSVPGARALGLLALVALGAGNAWMASDHAADLVPGLFDALRQVLPGAHLMDLWRPAPVAGAAAGVLVAIGCSAFALGHLRFARRDA